MDTKTCTGCRQTKPKNSFSLSRPGFLRPHCKSCRASEFRKYYNAQIRPHKMTKPLGRPVSTTTEHRRMLRNELNRNWRKNNPEKWSLINRARRHHRRTLGPIDKRAWTEKCQAFDNKCLSCHMSTKLTIDHKIPVSLGGTNHISNLQPLCLDCNQKKHTKYIDYEVHFAAA